MQALNPPTRNGEPVEVEERVVRIARAMCRSRRLDPDAPLGLAGSELLASRPVLEIEPGRVAPIWLLFIDDAKCFVSANREVASQL